MDRIERANRDAEILVDCHKVIRDIDDLGQYTDLLEHIARKARIQREYVRLHAATSRR